MRPKTSTTPAAMAQAVSTIRLRSDTFMRARPYHPRRRARVRKPRAERLRETRYLKAARPSWKLRRLAAKKLNLFDATMLVMGGIIGVGIFFNPRAIAELVPHPVAFLAMWVVG